MHKILILFLIPIFSIAQIFNQKIPDSLAQKANAVILQDLKKIEILQVDKMLETTHREVMVYNKQGLDYIDANVYYDKSVSIQKLEIKILDFLGREIKTIKKKDMKDYSASGSSTFMSDNRILVLDYTPTSYPFTVVIDYVKTDRNTAFIPSWRPIRAYNIGIVKNEFILENSSGIDLNLKEINFENYPQIKFEKENNKVTYSLSNFAPLIREELAPYFWNFAPYVKFGLKHFYLEGVEGDADNWDVFGKWVNTKLLNDVEDLPEDTKLKIVELVKETNDPIEKAKIVYHYMQNKTRYISVQLGIGGWKPMLAEDVDKLGYGDCKALSNYTKSLLEVAGVPSYYTIIYAGQEKEDIEKELVSLQGTHAILTIPNGDEYLFLECTSQTDPFNYQGKFTDDRQALIIKEEGAEIIHTNSFKDEENKQLTSADITIDDKGNIKVKTTIRSFGNQFEKYHYLEGASRDKQDEYYKYKWGHINNLFFESIKLNIDKNKIEIAEDVSFSAQNYADVYPAEIILCPNVLNRETYIPKRYRNRKMPFSIERGYYDADELLIAIPQGYDIESLPDNFKETSIFGDYEISFEKLNEKAIRYKRKFLLKRGDYTPEQYDSFRKFLEKIVKADNIKILIKKK